MITFQVIEHIKKDHLFIQEVKRILKPGGKLIIATPNILMSLTRNPWHVREYTPAQFDTLLSRYFRSVEKYGVFGNEKIMTYYEKTKPPSTKSYATTSLNCNTGSPANSYASPMTSSTASTGTVY